MKRKDGRKADEIRKIKIVRDFLKHPAGSVWIEMGDTKLICSATVDDYVPFHRRGSGGGWVTAEYAMMPGATGQRSMREVDLDKLGERTLIIDADVVQADGGTRTAAITGSFIALYDALLKLKKDGKIKSIPTSQFLAAVSVGVVGDSIVLDLPYSEDVEAKVDMNVVMTESGRFVEVQGTAEGIPFSKKQLDSMLELAEKGIRELISAQKKALGVK
jgi:ribonuclease PH